MAIIKCPECGHQISDKAPVCPSCGVEIAGKITRCPQCGEVYFKVQDNCPNCHHSTTSQEHLQQPRQEQVSSQNTNSYSPDDRSDRNTQVNSSFSTPNQSSNAPQNNKKRREVFIISLILALIGLGIVFYFYNDAKNSKELSAYEYAMTSSDPLVLQSFLDTYKDASQSHIDSIQAHLTQLKLADTEWTNAVVNNSKEALQDYLAKYPGTPHRIEIQHKIDSLDWAQASNENTLESYKLYLVDHANGEHVDDANNSIKDLNAKDVQPEEKSAIASIFRNFLQSINAKDDEGLTNTVASHMTSFLGKADATKNDVSTFLVKIYKDDITRMNWQSKNDYKIDKKEVGLNEYEYSVQFSAVQEIERTDATKEKTAKYRITSTIGPDGKITAFNMTKILE